MVRATTGGVLKSYRTNLMNSFTTLNKARDTVLSQRVFNSYAEDPASAAKAFKLRKSRMSVESQHSICNDTYRKYQTAWSCLDTVDKLIDTDNGKALSTLQGTTLKMLNDPTGDARTQLAEALDQMSEAVVQTMNQTYGGNFIFAGADGHNVPFEVKDNKLYYRGVNVDAAVPETAKGTDGKLIECDENGVATPGGDYYLKTQNATVVPDSAVSIDYNFIHSDPGGGWNTYGNFAVYDENGARINYDPDNSDKSDCYLVCKGALVDTPAPTDPKNLLSIADYEAYCEACGQIPDPADGHYVLQNVTKDLVPPPRLLSDATGNAVEVQDPAAANTRAAGKYYLQFNGEPEVISKEEYEANCSEAEKLKYLANEKYFVDIGLGFQENEKGNLIESSGFNASLIGLNFIGYGQDADGDPKNIYSLVQKMKEIAGRASDGADWSEADYEEFNGLVKKLAAGSSEFKTAYTNMDAGTTKLKNNLALLEENFYNLQEQYADIEDADMVESISSFVWAQYCYNAALKVGNSILSESLMDYLN